MAQRRVIDPDYEGSDDEEIEYLKRESEKVERELQRYSQMS